MQLNYDYSKIHRSTWGEVHLLENVEFYFIQFSEDLNVRAVHSEKNPSDGTFLKALPCSPI